MVLVWGCGGYFGYSRIFFCLFLSLRSRKQRVQGLQEALYVSFVEMYINKGFTRMPDLCSQVSMGGVATGSALQKPFSGLLQESS